MTPSRSEFRWRIVWALWAAFHWATDSHAPVVKQVMTYTGICAKCGAIVPGDLL